MTTGFFSWRWAPAVVLVALAIVLALVLVWLIPSNIGEANVTRASPSPVTRAPAGDLERAEHVDVARDVAPAAAPEFAPIRTLAAPEPARTSVESFFPSAPVAELPPPLPDDPVPPEPPARALDPVGRGVEPESAPPQQ
jgi:hypothetical protein